MTTTQKTAEGFNKTTLLDSGLYAFRSNSYTNPLDSIQSGGAYVINDPIINDQFQSISRMFDMFDFTKTLLDTVLGLGNAIDYFYVCKDGLILFSCSEEDLAVEYLPLTWENLQKHANLD